MHREGGLQTHQLDPWLERYDAAHRNPVDRVLHWICVPVMLWSVVALLWLIPVPIDSVRQGTWAVLALFIAYLVHHRSSRQLGWAVAVLFAVMALIAARVHALLEPHAMLRVAIVLLIVSLAGQLAGRLFGNRRERGGSDPRFLLVGPAWFASRVLRRLGIHY